MTYKVKSGDSLSIIARDVLGDINQWPTIAKLNNIASPYIIQPGQVLQLPDKSNAVPAATTTTIAPAKTTTTTVKTTTPAKTAATSSTTDNNSTSSISFLGLGIGGLVVLGALIGLVVMKKKKGAAKKAVKPLKK